MSRILCLGDSIMAGWPTANGFRGKLARELGDQASFVGPLVDDTGLRHAGYLGHAPRHVLGKLGESLREGPTEAIVSLGGNALPDGAPEMVGFDVTTLCGRLLSNGCRRVLVCSIPDASGMSSSIASYNRAMKQLASQVPGVVFLDGVGESIGRATIDSPFYSDRVHPSALGYEHLANEILRRGYGIESSSAFVGGEPPKSEAELAIEGAAAFSAAFPGLSKPVRQYAVAVGILNNALGQSGAWAPLGVASNNWGALLYRPEHAGMIEIGATKYGKFATLKEGAIAFFNGWTSPDLLDAIGRGDTRKVAAAMGMDGAYGEQLQAELGSVAGALHEDVAGNYRSSLLSAPVLVTGGIALALCGATLWMRNPHAHG